MENNDKTGQKQQNGRSKTIKYGDKIYLSSTEMPQLFLSARSQIEEKVFFIQELDPSVQITAYDNILENIFCIYPKLNYDAEKRYTKTLNDDIEDEQKEIYFRRKENEKIHNDNIIQRYMGKNVTIGSEIILYHILSNSFVKCSLDKQDTSHHDKAKQSASFVSGDGSESNEKFDLKLSQTLDGTIIFKIKIDPYYTFKKDGEIITYEDQFYFQCPKLKTNIVYKNPLKINYMTQKQRMTNMFKSRQDREQEQKIDQDTKKYKPGLHPQDKQNYPPIFENSQAFAIFQAGHSKNKKQINTFKAIHIQDSSANNSNDIKTLYWGDYVRIRHILRENTIQGFLCCQTNICGFNPHLYLQTRKTNNKNEKDCISSIFQLIPPSENLLGKKIQFKHIHEQTKTIIILRHVLTGQYLSWDQETEKIGLSQSLNDFLKDKKNKYLKSALDEMDMNIQKLGTKPLRQNVDGKKDSVFKRCLLGDNAIKDFNKARIQSGIQKNNSLLTEIKEENDKKGKSLTNDKVKEEDKNEEEDEEEDEEEEEETQQKQESNILGMLGKKNKITKSSSSNSQIQRSMNRRPSQFENIDIKTSTKFQKFFQNKQIIITSSSSEEDYLSTNSCFSISNKNNLQLIINEEGFFQPLFVYNEVFQDKDYEYEGYIDDELYIKTWHQYNPLNMNLHSISSNKENADFFFLSTVNQEEITNLSSLYSKFYPIQLLANNPANIENMQILESSLSSIIKLCLWICDSEESNIEQISTIPLKERQSMVREIGLIDMVIKILHSIYSIHNFVSQNMKKDQPYIYKLCMNMIQFLKLSINGNQFNAIYTFQWYPFFKIMITSKTVQLPTDMQIDQLVKDLFILTDFGPTYERDIQEIASNLDFSKHNNQAINLLIGFCLFSNTRQQDSYEEMVKIIFSEEKDNIFKNFLYDNQLKIQIDDENEVVINSSLQEDNPELFKYILSILTLTSEVCKGGNGSLLQKYIQQIYPFYICVQSISNVTLQSQVRALFLDLLSYSYMAYDYRYTEEKRYPQAIKFSYETKPDKDILEQIQNKEYEFSKKYSKQNKQGVDSKQIIIESDTQIEDDVKSIDLKGFLNRYLKNLSGSDSVIKKDDNYLIHSVLKVINFLMSKGFFHIQADEVKNLQYCMNNFLEKGFISLSMNQYNEEEIESSSIMNSQEEEDENMVVYPVMSDNVNTQTILKDSKSPRGKGQFKLKSIQSQTKGTSQHIVKDQAQSSELQEAQPWMIETLNGLYDIEQYNQNQKLEKFFQDKKILPFFEDSYENALNKLNISKSSKTQTPIAQKNKLATQVKQHVKKLSVERQQKITDFISNFISNPSNKESQQIQKYMDILTLNDTQLCSAIVKLITLIFSRRKNFLKSFNELSFIYNKNIDQYNQFLDIYNKLHIKQIDLQNLIATKEKEQEKKLYNDLHEILLLLMKEIFLEADDPDMMIQNELEEAEQDEVHRIPPGKDLSPKPNNMGKSNSQTPIGNQNFGFSNVASNNILLQQGNQTAKGLLDNNNDNEGFQTPINNKNINLDMGQQQNQNQNGTERPSLLNLQKIDNNGSESQRKYKFEGKQTLAELQNQNNSSNLQIGSTKKKNTLQKDKIVWNILDIFQFEITSAYKIQDLLRHMNFHEKIIKLLQQISGKIGAKKDENQSEKQLIIEKCLVFLIYFLLKNVKNQNVIAEHPQFNSFLSDVFSIRIKNLQTYILIFISEIYKDNYHLLIHLNKQEDQSNSIFKKLKLKLPEEVSKKNYQYCIYFFQMLVCFFKIQSATVIQNQQWIFQEIFQSDKLDFSKIFLEVLDNVKYIQINDELKGNRIFIPDSIAFISTVLNITRQLVTNQGYNTQTVSVIKAFLSIKHIEEMLQGMDKWYPLRLELVQFFIEIYIQCKKLEENELKMIRSIIKNILYQDIENYVNDKEIYDNQQNDRLSLKTNLNNKIYQNLHKNIFSHRTTYSTDNNIIMIEYETAENNYMVFGVIEAISAYIDIFSSDISNITDLDIEIIEKYNSILDRLGQIWDINYNFINNKIKNQIDIIKAKSQFLNGLTTQDKKAKAVSPITSKYPSPNKNFKDSPAKKVGFSESNSMIGFQEIAGENKEQYIQIILSNLTNKIYHVENHKITLNGLQALDPSPYVERIDKIWEKIRARNTDLVSDQEINKHHDLENDNLVKILVQIKKVDSIKFKDIIQNLINILTNEGSKVEIKIQTMKILRNLANYRNENDIETSTSIHKDLCDLGFTDFLCEVISKDKDHNSKLEYILALCDFLDEGDFDIQKSVLEYMQKDTENIFLQSIHDFIMQNFNDFKEYEKGLQKDHTDQIYLDIRSVINRKIHCVKYALLVLKLSCEGHFEEMQNFLREQIINGKKIPKSIDMISLGSNLFREYIKVVNTFNISLGEGILDYLIEVLQGPCEKNQLSLSETKILEDIEDIIYKFTSKSIKVGKLKSIDLEMSGFTQRIYIFLLALAEGTNDQYILEKLGNYLNPRILLKRLQLLYKNIVKTSKKELRKQIEGIEKNNFKQSIVNDVDLHNKYVEELEHQEIQLLLDTQDDMKMTDQQWESYVSVYIENLKYESLIIYILLKSIAQQSPQVKQKIKEEKNQIISEYIIHQQKNTPGGFASQFSFHSSKSKSKKSKKNSKKQIAQQKSLQKSNSLLDSNMSSFVNAMKYYKNNVARIEIVNSLNEIQVLYFPKPTLTNYLSFQSKKQFKEQVNRDSANDKINGLLNQQQDFIDEMQYFQYLTSKIPINFSKIYANSRSLALFLYFLINIFILFDKFDEECEECIDSEVQCVCDEQIYSTELDSYIRWLGWITFILNIITFFLWAILQLSLDLRKFERFFNSQMQLSNKTTHKKDLKQLELKLEFQSNIDDKSKRSFKQSIIYTLFKIKFFIFNSYFFYLLCSGAITFIGIYISRIFFCILLLDIIDRSIILKNVIKSITVNFVQLGMTGILGVVIMFIYSMIAFYSNYIRSSMETLELEVPVCDSPIMCFMFVVNLGLRSGGGVGEPLIQPDPYNNSDYYSRFFFDLTFFLIIIIIWMNIIFGIIIDTFAALRDEKTQKDLDSKNKCFICSMERTEFEKEGLSFDNHTSKQHDLWNYFYYIVYLREKDQIDYNGTESYVAEKIKMDDISWFPIGCAIALDKVQREDDKDEEIAKTLHNIEHNVSQIKKQQQLHQRENKNENE